MKHYYSLIVLACLMITIAQPGQAQQPRDLSGMPIGIHTTFKESAIQATNSLIQSLINQTNLDTLIRTVNILSGEDSVTIHDSTYLFLSRNAEHPHNDLAADFIFQTLNSYGLPTYNQQYSANGRNVYSVQAGTVYPGKIFIVCAHYDDMPFQPAPGADDNASGVAAVLEAARILSRIPTPYTIIYALWDEEEVGKSGSAYYAQQAFLAEDDILGVVNLDVLGWDGNNDGLIEIHSRPIANSVELADLIYSLEDDHNLGLSPVIRNPGTTNSDHANFWGRRYSAVLLIQGYTSGDYNPFVHKSTDEIEHFNLDYFHALSKLAVATISYLSLNNIPTTFVSEEPVSVSGFMLHQNYPNPFSSGTRSRTAGNPSTTIEFVVPESAFVTLKVYDLQGEEVATLVAEQLGVGSYQYDWAAKGMSSGVYFYRIEAGNSTQTRKMLLIR